MSIGTGIATAGWFLAFVWACSISDNTVAGLVVAGLAVAVAQFLCFVRG